MKMKKLKYKLLGASCLAASLMMFSTSAVGYIFTRGDLQYLVLTEHGSTGTVEVFGNDSVSGDITIPSSVEYGGITYSVTSIGDLAFDRYWLTSVEIPNSVTSIGEHAFENCILLTSITIPDSVTSIGRYAFYNTSLSSVKIPNGVTSIEDYVFTFCNMTSITIPDSVTSIGEHAFDNCHHLTSVVIGNSVRTIGDRAFIFCDSLTSIRIPNSVTSIGSFAFYGCDGLTSVKIPNSVTSIRDYAFSNCSSLTSVVIGNGVTSIGWDAFSNCSNLTSVYYRGNVPAVVFWIYQDTPETLISYYPEENSSWTAAIKEWHKEHGGNYGYWQHRRTSAMYYDPSLSLKMYRVVDGSGYQNANASAGADEPLIPLANEAELKNHLEEVSQGIAADGVTPLVFSVTESGKTTEDHTYQINLSVDEPSKYIEGIERRLYVIGDSGYIQWNQLTVRAHPQGEATTYFYLSGIDSKDLPTFGNEVNYSVKITDDSDTEPLAVQEFKVRRPPIVLVHGFNSEGDDWKSDFKNSLYYTHPEDFVYDLKYGFDPTIGVCKEGNYENTYGSLIHLVGVLDKELKQNVEGRNDGIAFWDGWACTRYDMICHSQGGVLTRMLCTQDAVWIGDVPAYRNEDNYYRGRFHRVVTIGSPQNGASILYYMIQMKKKSFAILQAGILPTFLKPLYQEKFDPWGFQIKYVNSKPIDPAAKFHSVWCRVNGIPVAHHALGLGYRIGVLGGRTGEEIVHPFGSDGVVDMVSQAAGGTRGSLFENEEVCHAPKAIGGIELFGTPFGETTTGFMGLYVRLLLDGDGSDFGNFHLPAPAPEYWKEEIDRYVLSASAQIKLDELSIILPETHTTRKIKICFSTLQTLNGLHGSMVYTASDDTEVHWFAEVFGSNGVTTEGVIMEADPDDPMGVLVSIDDSVIGDVVIYGNYQAEDGSIVYAKPTVIYSNQPGTDVDSIKLEPNELTMIVGDVIEPDLWVTYSNQQSSQLFIGNGTDVTFTSSDPKVVKVEGNLLTALSAGTAVITAEYKGMTCTVRYTVKSSDYEEEDESIDYEVNNNQLTIFFTGSLYESPDGVDHWKCITAESPYIVIMDEQKKFYRSCNDKFNGEGGMNITIPLSDDVNLDMIWIKPGTFRMGSPEYELGRGNSEIQHKVTLTEGYWLGKYEVTQAQYEAIMGTNPSDQPDKWGIYHGVGDNYPVYNISWYDAKAFCEKLTEIEKAAGRLPEGYEYTLPTEAQWEYACRAGTTTAFNNGTNIPTEEQVGFYYDNGSWHRCEPCPNLDEVGWYSYNSGYYDSDGNYTGNDKTSPVGQKQPNAWGLYDMHGNVEEWCLDWYGAYPASSVTDPVGPFTGEYRVIRGGGWGSYASNCRSARRYGDNPDTGKYGKHGFRIALAPAPIPISGKDTIIPLTDDVKLDMIWIEPGTFIMGSPEDERGRSERDDETQHSVTISNGFWIGKYEVTQVQYKTVMGDNPSYFNGDNNPVDKVNWQDAMVFCKKLTEIKKAVGRLPEGYEYTLPTEAQWEYACRAGTTTALNSGKNLTNTNQCPEMDEVGWYWYNSNNMTHPVGQKKPNAWGLYDMHGNVREWCLDWYDDYPTTAVTDPTGPAIGKIEVNRGGCWLDGAWACRSAYRYDSSYLYNSPYGFRVVLSPVQ